jgi:error-prone DNA polymerase
MKYAKGLRDQTAEAIAASRRSDGNYRSIEELATRVPSINRKELTILARIGALNQLNGVGHRRDALWQMQRAGIPEGPLLRANSKVLREPSRYCSLKQMTTTERMIADYSGTGLTIDRHPMSYRREQLQRSGVVSAKELRNIQNGMYVRTAGCIIARQRPGTAMGFIFLSMEDETGIANVIVTPDVYERHRSIVTRSKFIRVDGLLQNQEGVIHIKATRLVELSEEGLEVRSHDFY